MGQATWAGPNGPRGTEAHQTTQQDAHSLIEDADMALQTTRQDTARKGPSLSDRGPQHAFILCLEKGTQTSTAFTFPLRRATGGGIKWTYENEKQPYMFCHTMSLEGLTKSQPLRQGQASFSDGNGCKPGSRRPGAGSQS